MRDAANLESPSPRAGWDGPFAGRLHQPGAFIIGLEIRTRHEQASPTAEELRSCISGCAGTGLVQGFFISDIGSAAGGPSSDLLGKWILDSGGEPVLSLSLAVRDRTEGLDRARIWRESGARNLLVVTGDYPRKPEPGRPLFDLDSVQMLMELREAPDRIAAFPPDLHLGCVVSPFKTRESELMWQYARLRRKIAVGADFVVSQAGYDPRAWDELMRFCRVERLATPVIGQVIIPDAELADRIGAGRVPGVSIPAHVLGRFASRETRTGFLLAAAAVAIHRGLGFQGVLLGGRPLMPPAVAVILEEAERLAPRWEECLELFRDPLPRFSLFLKDERTGLNQDGLAEVACRTRPRLMYLFSHAVDHLAFGSVESIFRILTRVCRFCDARPLWRKALWWLEYFSKVPLYRCRMCGDCTLYACGFLCSESGCPKRMLNGPCGGSRDGRCEVSSAGMCMWVKVYDRLKAGAERPAFQAPPVPPKDRGLAGTCSWINFCLGRDHRKLRIEQPPAP